MNDYDIVIIGGGTGGLVAAREARRRGARVVIIHDGPLGGDCTHSGCIPSKALLAAAARGDSFSEAMAAVHRAVDHMASTEDAAALTAQGIDVIAGRARFREPRVVEVDGLRIGAARFVVATGARPLVPEVPGLRELPPLTNETLFSLREQPASLAVLGGGPIGCEMAQAFARLGTTVTIIEAEGRLLPREEPEASAAVSNALTADGVIVRTGSKVVRVERTPASGPARGGRNEPRREEGERQPRDPVRLAFDSADPVVADHVLAAIGRAPSGRGFGLEDIGVALDDRGSVTVDATTATNVAGIWAVGDVTGGLQFTHVAARMGWIAARNALSRSARVHKTRFDMRVVPWATFTSPEVGRVGLTEAEAAERHSGAQVAFVPFDDFDRAVATGEQAGFVKLIAVPRWHIPSMATGRIVGATAVAPTGGELVHEAALAMQTNMLLARLAQTIHAYPTWSMAMQQAALQFVGTYPGPSARPAQRASDITRSGPQMLTQRAEHR